jgi:DNA processing protein
MVTPLLLQYLQLTAPGDYAQAALARALRRVGSLAALVEADPACFAESGVDALGYQAILTRLQHAADVPAARVRQLETWLAGGTRHLLSFEDPCYPPLLKELDCPPPLLYVAGDVHLLSAPQLAMVGSRKASESGRRVAHWLASELAGAGFTVTSGLAVGIDAQAHRGALEAGGRSVAVVGTGLDLVYPPAHRSLAERLLENGALISEFPLGTPPLPGNFPQRNRLIAGLSAGVVVVEAAPRSGSLITARLAMEANREVFAVPGSIHNGNARGCHQLIRQGAKLVDSLESILEELTHMAPHRVTGSDQVVPLPPAARHPDAIKPAGPSSTPVKAPMAVLLNLMPEEQRMLQYLDQDPSTTDDLVQRTGLPIEQVSRLLLALELKGLVMQVGGRFQRRITRAAE